MYREELGHMKKLINYQLIRGGTPNINVISIDSNVTLLNAFTQALELEKNVTEQLGSLVCLAEKYYDHQCAEFVTSKFLSEQILAVNEIAHKIVHLHRVGDNKHALYNFDLQLAKCFPYSLLTK
ncbi:hypothetical protein evm_009381 [Chilo suppressalis]|nr:hypothetical protein evm_009381 [Chilo suppressalis]